MTTFTSHDHIHMHCAVNGATTEAGSFLTIVVSGANSKQAPCAHNAQCTARIMPSGPAPFTEGMLLSNGAFLQTPRRDRRRRPRR